MVSLTRRGLFASAAAALLAGCSSSETRVRAAMKPDQSRKPAPDFVLKDSNGASVKLSDYRGKVVLLNFWATWCGPCKIEIPWFIEFEQNYKDKGFAVLGVSMDDDGWDAVKPYIASRKINYRVVVGNDEMSAPYGLLLPRGVAGIDSLPTTFLIDRDGRVASSHEGLVSKKNYESEVVELLGENNRASR